MAQSTLTILATAFALSLSFLIPMLSTQVRGEIGLAVAAFAIYRGIRVWWPVFRLQDRGRRQVFVQSFWLLLLPFTVYIYLMLGGVGLMRGDTTAVVTVGGAVLSMFIVALRNTWRLVVNVEQDSGS